MRTTRRKTPASKPKSKARRKVTKHVISSRKTLGDKRVPEKSGREATFVYECTRAGCGYRIVRDEKGEQGQLRFDLKCPKCHNNEFRCLGKGDLPETFNIPVPATSLNFETFKTIGLGSN